MKHYEDIQVLCVLKNVILTSVPPHPLSGPVPACPRDIYKDINLVTATLISDLTSPARTEAPGKKVLTNIFLSHWAEIP